MVHESEISMSDFIELFLFSKSLNLAMLCDEEQISNFMPVWSVCSNVEYPQSLLVGKSTLYFDQNTQIEFNYLVS